MEKYVLKQYDDDLLYFFMHVDKLNGLEVKTDHVVEENRIFLHQLACFTFIHVRSPPLINPE